MTFFTSYTDLTGLPNPHPFVETFSYQFSKTRLESPTISFVVPVFNKEKTLSGVIASLISCLTDLTSEFIFIDDASTDDSLSIIWTIVDSFRLSAIVVSSSIPVFETACDNIGFSLARGSYICELQSDIYINDPTFFKRAISVLNLSFVSIVSGRCGHSWDHLIPYRLQSLRQSVKQYLPSRIRARKYEVGLFGRLFFERDLTLTDKYFYLVDTVNRGPLLFKSSTNPRFFSRFFFLGGDDHFYNICSFFSSRRPAYVPCRCYSIESDGSTRQPRTSINQTIFSWLSAHKHGNFFVSLISIILPRRAVRRMRLPSI